jgi:multidrug efflux pump subunit AcrB
MLETSVQAQFMIPMAVSLAFGVVFATAITLVVVPCLLAVFVREARAPAAGAT